jgi:hypothetical protein
MRPAKVTMPSFTSTPTFEAFTDGSYFSSAMTSSCSALSVFMI